jgi:hypothetical protein
MNRIFTIAALALVLCARFAVAEDGDDKKPEPKGDDRKAEGKDGKRDEGKDREARAWAEKKAAEARRLGDERKKCERDGHHRCAEAARRACTDRECERTGHKKCQEEARARCKRACEEMRLKAKKEKGGDDKGEAKGKLGMKPGDIVPGGKPKDGGDGDAKGEKGGDGDGKGDAGCDGKEKGEEKGEPKDKEKGEDEGDGTDDLK